MKFITEKEKSIISNLIKGAFDSIGLMYFVISLLFFFNWVYIIEMSTYFFSNIITIIFATIIPIILLVSVLQYRNTFGYSIVMTFFIFVSLIHATNLVKFIISVIKPDTSHLLFVEPNSISFLPSHLLPLCATVIALIILSKKELLVRNGINGQLNILYKILAVIMFFIYYI